MMNKLTISLCSALALWTSVAMAADAPFVSARQVHLMQILATPPAPGSAQSQAELAQLHQLEASRSAEEVSRARADENEQTIFMYRSVLGDKFTAAALPLTAALSARINYDDGANTGVAKRSFHRIRPYNLDKTLHPVCKTHAADDSYPSGHSTNGYMQALVLIEMVPEMRDAILARADDYAHNRLVCGVHFPSDVQGGRLTAYAAHALLADSAAYQRQMTAARRELRATLGLAPLAD